MATLFDFITIDNNYYNQLTDKRKKARLEKFVQRIKDKGLEEKLLSFINRKYDVSERPDGNGFTHKTNLPEDLSKQIDQVWVHLND